MQMSKKQNNKITKKESVKNLSNLLKYLKRKNGTVYVEGVSDGFGVDAWEEVVDYREEIKEVEMEIRIRKIENKELLKEEK